MRIDLSINRLGWIDKLDYKKLILIVFLLRFILACGYDVFVSLTDNDILLPDARLYTIRGRYVALLLNGYAPETFTKDMVPAGAGNIKVFLETMSVYRGKLPILKSEVALYSYMVGILYFIFGYFPLAARVLNICLSIGSAYLLFRVAKYQFGSLVANLFLVIALFLPTQTMYSITLSRDLIRMFTVSFVVWLIYGGSICLKKQGS